MSNAKLYWTRTSDVCIEAECGAIKYAVAASRVIRDGELVSIFQGVRFGKPSAPLALSLERDECIAACEADAALQGRGRQKK